MVVVGETGGIGSKAIATRDPVVEGITAGTTKQTGTVLNLVPELSLIPAIEEEGL